MITVRFSSGHAVQYNRATSVEHQNTFRRIKTKAGGDLIAIVPLDCLIEFESPCRVYNGMAQDSNQRIEALTKEIRLLKRKIEKVNP